VARLKKGVLKGLEHWLRCCTRYDCGGIRHLHELKLYEVSVVTFPMNEMATVSSLKSDEPVANFRATLEACRNRFARGV
jgi:phage head maturation protease